MKDFFLKNKYMPYVLTIVGIPILTSLISLFFALIKNLSTFSNISSFIFFLGFFLSLGNLLYYVTFKGNQKKIENIKNNPPLQNCLVCKSNIITEETRITDKLGIPSSDVNLECPTCFSRIKSHFPFANWMIEEVYQKENPDFSWLYAGETLTTEELILVSNGHFTNKAISKIRARELGKISNGEMSALENMDNKDLILSADNVDTFIFPKINIDKSLFSLQKDEKFLIAANNISLQKLSSRNNVAYQTEVDNGNLFITNHRIAFFSNSKNIAKRLTVIEDIRQKKYNLYVYFGGRKTPDIFVNLDEALFASVLEGITRKHE